MKNFNKQTKPLLLRYFLLTTILILIFSVFSNAFFLRTSEAVSLVQTTSVFSSSSSSNSPVTTSFSNSISSGNTLVITVGCLGCTSVSVSDSLGTSLSELANRQSASNFAGIWSGVASSSGSDTITATWTGASFYTVTGYEISGVTTTSSSTSSLNTAGACGCSVSSFPLLNGITIEVGYVNLAGTSYSGQTWTTTSGYNCLGPCGFLTSDAQGGVSAYALNTAGSSTLPMSLSGSSSSNLWIETAVTFDNTPSGLTTTTKSITIYAVNAPNPNTAQYWIFGLLALFAPVGLLDGMLLGRDKAQVDSNTLIFMTLLGLFAGGILGLLMNVLPFGVTLAIGALFVIYLWRGRG